MIVAGLDVATMTGVCLGEPGKTPGFWSFDMGAGRSHERRFANAMRLARCLIADHNVGLIGIEAPVKARHDKKSTNELLMGLIACIRGWAEIKGVPCRTFEVATIDRHFLGARMAGGRAARKAAIQGRCSQLGWRPQTEDEADAGAVFDLTCSTISRSHAIASTPLFCGGRA